MSNRKTQRLKRAKHRNEQRRERNQKRREAPVAEAPKPERARHMTQLEFLLGRRSITGRQYKSGDRLYRDWRAAGDEPRVVPRYDRAVGLSSSDVVQHQVEARLRFQRAIQAVGQIRSAVVVHVCLLDQKLSDWVMPSDKGAEVLREGLDALSGWYDSERQHEVEMDAVA